MDSTGYTRLLNDRFMPYVNSMTRHERSRVIFMQDNAPSHASRHTKQFLADNGFVGNRLMEWPSSSPDINPIENYWSVFKAKLYQSGRQFSNNDQLWQAITDTFAAMDRGLIATLTKSMNNRVIEIFKRNGNYISH